LAISEIFVKIIRCPFLAVEVGIKGRYKRQDAEFMKTFYGSGSGKPKRLRIRNL
jgi:hypothetical protein